VVIWTALLKSTWQEQKKKTTQVSLEAKSPPTELLDGPIAETKLIGSNTDTHLKSHLAP
jgi:hypothetical protein